ncbi:Integral membrane sensor signal transduction histidine kinase [uncultured Paludibacter sp.]|uniref:histidine kinase n=1 Tax=uncultured Paludibacter sp. TaxID=497635 RepID=A0A653AK50_9BACT|nr:Integral membrane sensor signal transduction histidine kinase [uncultured Paludibacter sp.]
MNKAYQNTQILKFGFIAVAMIIVIASTFFTNRLAKALSVEERKKIETWAEATKLLNSTSENTDLNFILKILQDNTTIPVILADENGEIIEHRNIPIPEKNAQEFLKNKLEKLKTKHEPFIIQLDRNVRQYIYYDDSLLLKQLYVFPYIQFGVIIIFIMISYFAFSGTKRAEQNRVWVGLSKETAHQLGTPISSLLAWTELLKSRYGDDKLISDMGKDVNRLRIIAERFSKIGSKPDLKSVEVYKTLENAVNYIRNRASNKVEINLLFSAEKELETRLNVPLFEWVIENLCKNAIDAMNGSGKIDIKVKNTENEIIIDVCDTGKGMERKMFKAIFSPGFTTKERGWGLGLSLAKRIIEEYHKGKIFVKQSEINIGTTFRIILPYKKAE